ncbi:MAG: uracil-DNA glycosylase family protein, partial [Acidobacteriota bacterium]|nr:uracil-DNA glycosylase family protein [Acidobacteriota bacterium]
PMEISNCRTYLEAELSLLTELLVIVALGRIAFDGYWRLAANRGVAVRPRPRFQHGLVHTSTALPDLVASYHPSRQNTQTGRLTPAMLAEVFRSTRALVDSPADSG